MPNSAAWFEIKLHNKENRISISYDRNKNVEFGVVSENIKKRLLDKCQKTDEWQNNYSYIPGKFKII